MAAPEASIGDLLRQLVDDGNHLIRTEIRLAKAEVRDNLMSAARSGVGVGLGGVLMLGAVFTLLGAAVVFLTPVVGAGWAAVIVGVAAFALGGALIAGAVSKLKHASVVPDRTVRSVRRDAEKIGDSVR